MACTKRRTFISGLVSLLRTRPMRSLRCSGVSVSVILCEHNSEYARIATRRLEPDAGLFAQVAAE